MDAEVALRVTSEIRGDISAAGDSFLTLVEEPIAPAILLDRISWLARNTRPFVSAPAYCGPDRRFRKAPPPDGIEDRRAEGIALAATPDRALSQNDIDALFN